MKKIQSLFFFISLTYTAFATEQETDLLIVGNDTIYLHTFPLEDLELKISPFGNSYHTAPGTACWRGYRAVWRIINGKLYLEKILRCNSDPEEGEQDISNLFSANGIQFQEKNGLILAEWVTTDLYKKELPESSFYKDKIHLNNDWNGRKKNRNKKRKLIIESGGIKLNRLKEKNDTTTTYRNNV